MTVTDSYLLPVIFFSPWSGAITYDYFFSVVFPSRRCPILVLDKNFIQIVFSSWSGSIALPYNDFFPIIFPPRR
jgi:hypothetical protein